jgi:meso-butanediol dehydrogenase / (S,S)-butanediol dehydrogenase / diacetyl reductase
VSSDEKHLSRGNVAGRLSGKVAAITGVGDGQGREIALLFARAGATVVGCDIDHRGLDGTRALAGKSGLTLDLSEVDATHFTAVQSWIDAAAVRHGGIDVLYNNAASAHVAPFADLSFEQWRETLRLELDIVFAPTKAVWRHMIARGGGSIINVGAMAGMRGCEVVGGIGQAAHSAGKGGVIAFTRQLAAEGAPYWIRANSLSPGPVLTPAAQARLDSRPEFKRVFEGATLLARPGRPIDIAYAGLFLASDEAQFVTGVNLPVDGGTSCKLGASFRQ